MSTTKIFPVVEREKERETLSVSMVTTSRVTSIDYPIPMHFVIIGEIEIKVVFIKSQYLSHSTR